MSGPDAMTSQEQDLLTRVARAMQASKAWPAVFDAGSAEVLARAAIEAIVVLQPKELDAATKAAVNAYHDADCWDALTEQGFDEWQNAVKAAFASLSKGEE